MIEQDIATLASFLKEPLDALIADTVRSPLFWTNHESLLERLVFRLGRFSNEHDSNPAFNYRNTDNRMEWAFFHAAHTRSITAGIAKAQLGKHTMEAVWISLYIRAVTHDLALFGRMAAIGRAPDCCLLVDFHKTG